MKILVAIANHGTKNDHFARRLIDEYREMDHDVDIVILTNIEKDWGPDVEIRVGAPTPNPWSLPFAHRSLFGDRRDDYDLFIYSEDDTLLTQRSIDAYTEVCSALPPDRIPGFLRYEETPEGALSICSIHSHFRWSPDTVEEHGGQTFAHITNEHSACYLLTKEQLARSIESGGFLVEAHEGRHDMLCSAATDPYVSCGMRRVICVSRIEDFLIAHLPNVYLGRFGITIEELRSQVDALEAIGRGDLEAGTAFPVETRIQYANWSRDCYQGQSEELSRFIPESAKTVLSIGCGNGGPEAALVARGLEVAAIPLDSVLGHWAEFRGVEVLAPDLVRGLEALENRTFDVILLHRMLHLAPDPVSVLTRAAPRVSAGGGILFSVPNFDHIPFRLGRMRNRPGFRDLEPFAHSGLHCTRPSVVARWCRESGLRSVRHPRAIEERFSKHHRVTLGLFPHWFARTLWTWASPPAVGDHSVGQRDSVSVQ